MCTANKPAVVMDGAPCYRKERIQNVRPMHGGARSESDSGRLVSSDGHAPRASCSPLDLHTLILTVFIPYLIRPECASAYFALHDSYFSAALGSESPPCAS